MNQSAIKLIAEWAGFKEGTKGSFVAGYYKYPDNSLHTGMPDLTSLDVLFKWVVPKAVDKIALEYECGSTHAYAILFKWWLQEAENSVVNAEALAQAVLKLIKDTK